MKIASKELFAILATAKFEMDKHPSDFKTTLPKVNKLIENIFTEWESEETLIIDKLPF